jgi:hypothetical protein
VIGALLVACNGGSGETLSSASATSAASESASASSTAPSTDPSTSVASGTDSGTDSGTSTGDPTTGEPTTGESTGNPTTTDTTTDPTDGTTTGGVDESGCDAACENLVMCVPDYPLDECLADCTADFEDGDTPECKNASAKANMCFGTLTCDQIDNEEYGECLPIFDEVDQACSGMGVCDADLQTMGKGCRVTFTCGDSISAMQCNQNNCTCLEDGQDVGQCMNDGFCALDLDAAIDAANGCCGWDF